MKYSIVLHKEPGSSWSVTVPDVPGCFSGGDTVEEALESVREALAMHFEGLVEDGQPLPAARDIEVHMANPDFASGIWALVDFDVTPYYGKAVRFNATLQEGLLKRIDDRVKESSSYASRSGFLAVAALNELERSQGRGLPVYAQASEVNA